MLEGYHKGGKSTFKGAQAAKVKTGAELPSFKMAKADPFCKGCDYYDGHICEFMDKTGHPRIMIDPPPEGARPGELGQYCNVRNVTGKKGKGPKPISLDGSRRRKKAE